jgi:tape measure domain-containing protein
MADLNVALILRLVDKATGPARAAMRALARLGGDGLMAQANTVSRGAGMMAVGLGRVTDAARTGAGAILAYQGLMVGIAAAFVRPAAQFERFNVQLTNLEGSSEGAKKAMVWIEDFATRTPLELEDTVAAYARLRAFGIDPTNGSMQAIVDTMAATGGNAETMEGIVLALGQAWTKGKLQGEEAMQMLERGIPVWDLLAEKTGKSAAELMKMSSAGELGRSEITLLIEALGEKNAGAAAAGRRHRCPSACAGSRPWRAP